MVECTSLEGELISINKKDLVIKIIEEMDSLHSL